LDTASVGVKINSGKVVRIEDSQIYGFAGSGVNFTPSTANARLIIPEHVDPRQHHCFRRRVAADRGRWRDHDPQLGDRRQRSGVGSQRDESAGDHQRLPQLDHRQPPRAWCPSARFGDIRLGSDEIANNTTAVTTATGGKITSFGNNDFLQQRRRHRHHHEQPRAQVGG